MEGKRASIQRDIMINGEYQFNEAKRIIFSRTWRDAAPPGRDNNGRPRPGQEGADVARLPSKNSTARTGIRLFLLHEGVNEIRMRAIREPMAKSQPITLFLRGRFPPMLKLRLSTKRKVKPVENTLVKFQAEYAYLKADHARMEFGWDPEWNRPRRATTV